MRKGGAKVLNRLPPKPDTKALAQLGDDRVLAESTRRLFSAGFAWGVIAGAETIEWLADQVGVRLA